MICSRSRRNGNDDTTEKNAKSPFRGKTLPYWLGMTVIVHDEG
jgi:hypothetical protein